MTRTEAVTQILKQLRSPAAVRFVETAPAVAEVSTASLEELTQCLAQHGSMASCTPLGRSIIDIAERISRPATPDEEWAHRSWIARRERAETARMFGGRIPSDPEWAESL